MKKILLIAVMSVFALAASADSWESGVQICGTKVTSSNVNDLLSLTKNQVKDGTISYDNETGVLTLDGLTMERSDAFAYFFRFTKTTDRNEYYVKINGHCIFDNSGIQKPIFYADDEVILIFDGIHKNPAEDEIHINTGNGFTGNLNSVMRLKNLNIVHSNIIFTLSGNGSSFRMQELSFINCNVKSSDQSGIFENLKQFRLINCAFVTPADATFNSAKYQVESEGAKLAHVAVEIKAKGTAIDQVKAEKVQNTKVIRNGQLLIERNGELFNLTGGRVE